MAAARTVIHLAWLDTSCRRDYLSSGLTRPAAGDPLRVASVGSNPAGYVHPLAIRVMQEIGIDITGHYSKHVGKFLHQGVETVITVNGQADLSQPREPSPSALSRPRSRYRQRG